MNRIFTPDFGGCPDDDPKVQAIRFIDLYFMGPAMMWIAVTHPTAPKWLKAFIFVSGVGTSLFNGANFMRCLDRQERERRRGMR